MNPNELILRYLHGEATDAEVAELDRLLACDPALRLKLIVETGIDAGLCEIARERASQPSAVVPRRSVWLSWRPLTAAAAGIVFGMFCTSVVFGYSMPRMVERVLNLVNAGLTAFRRVPITGTCISSSTSVRGVRRSLGARRWWIGRRGSTAFVKLRASRRSLRPACGLSRACLPLCARTGRKSCTRSWPTAHGARRLTMI